MVHITEYACFHEQGYYTPGDKGAPVFQTRAGKVGVAICYDRHFPEYMRALAVAGADLVIVPQAGAAGEWPDGLYEGGDARRGVSERILTSRCATGSAPKIGWISAASRSSARPTATSWPARRRAATTSCMPTSISRAAENSHARQLFLKHRRPELYAGWLGR